VFLVFAPERGRGARRACLDGGVQELVLVPHVAGAEIQQLQHALGRIRQREVVVGIHAAERQQGIRHAGPQRLVDAGVQVQARGPARGDLVHFVGVDLHWLSFGWGEGQSRNAGAAAF
jgi:hypothetical protein